MTGGNTCKYAIPLPFCRLSAQRNIKKVVLKVINRCDSSAEMLIFAIEKLIYSIKITLKTHLLADLLPIKVQLINSNY